MDIFYHRLARLMRPASETDPFDSDQHVYELKLEGIRCLAYLDTGETAIFTRSNRPILAGFPELAGLHQLTDGRCILDGTVVVGRGTAPDLAIARSRLRHRSPHIIRRMVSQYPSTFVAQDVLFHENAPVTDLPLADRLTLLRRLIREDARFCSARTIDGSGVLFGALVRERGLGGVVAKRKSSIYRMGRSTRDWLIFTARFHADFVICGYRLDEALPSALLLLGQYDADGSLRYKGRVTIPRESRELGLVMRRQRLPAPPFTDSVLEEKGGTWITPLLVCQISYSSLDREGRPVDPAFSGLCLHKLPYAAREGRVYYK